MEPIDPNQSLLKRDFHCVQCIIYLCIILFHLHQKLDASRSVNHYSFPTYFSISVIFSLQQFLDKGGSNLATDWRIGAGSWIKIQ